MTVSFRLFASSALAVLLVACAQMPSTGPRGDEVRSNPASPRDLPPIQVVDVDDRTARHLQAQRRTALFSEVFGEAASRTGVIGRGDTVEVSLWEAPPATLFGSASVDPRVPSQARATTLPEQVVDRDGVISVPFAGRIEAAGQTPQAVEAEIVRRLKGKANQPEVLVRVLRSPSSNVTVVGEVATSVRMPLSATGERLLDALAAAGGVKQPVAKMTVQLTRGQRYHALPLDTLIRDPRQNITLLPGDVITALHQPHSFTALGATGKNEEINFEAQGISLAQAIARSGGLLDNRSDAQSVFVFRFEPSNALEWPRQPVTTTPEGQVPVIYRFDLRQAGSFFVAQSFPMRHGDLLYVSNAPAAELQKFLNLVFSVVYPVLSTIQLTK